MKDQREYAVEHLHLGFYRHYKGGIYEVTGVTLHTETWETLVLYTNMMKQSFARPFSMWNETVDVGGDSYPRFEFIGPTSEAALQSLSGDLDVAREAERISSGIVAEGKDALVKAGVLGPVPDVSECSLITGRGLHGVNDCKACESECHFDRATREAEIAESRFFLRGAKQERCNKRMKPRDTNNV